MAFQNDNFCDYQENKNVITVKANLGVYCVLSRPVFLPRVYLNSVFKFPVG